MKIIDNKLRVTTGHDKNWHMIKLTKSNSDKKELNVKHLSEFLNQSIVSYVWKEISVYLIRDDILFLDVPFGAHNHFNYFKKWLIEKKYDSDIIWTLYGNFKKIIDDGIGVEIMEYHDYFVYDITFKQAKCLSKCNNLEV